MVIDVARSASTTTSLNHMQTRKRRHMNMRMRAPACASSTAVHTPEKKVRLLVLMKTPLIGSFPAFFPSSIFATAVFASPWRLANV